MKTLNEVLKKDFDPKEYFHNREIGAISAERGNLSQIDNIKRTHELHRDLLRSGFQVHSAKGGYIENYNSPQARKVYENSFIVSHNKTGENGGVKEVLLNLGKKYEQDSIMHKPYNSEVASFHGTNETGYPGLGKKEDIGTYHSFEPGNEPEFHTKMPNGKIFNFS